MAFAISCVPEPPNMWWIDNLMTWRLKTGGRWQREVALRCLIGWIERRPGVMTEQQEARGAFIPWPQRGTKDKRLQLQRKGTPKLSAQLFFMLIRSSLPAIHCQNNPHFNLMLWMLTELKMRRQFHQMSSHFQRYRSAFGCSYFFVIGCYWCRVLNRNVTVGQKLSGSEEFVPEEGFKYMYSMIPKSGVPCENYLIWSSFKNSNTQNFLFFKMTSFKLVKQWPNLLHGTLEDDQKTDCGSLNPYPPPQTLLHTMSWNTGLQYTQEGAEPVRSRWETLR